MRIQRTSQLLAAASLLVVASTAAAQSGTITGRVTAADTRAPVSDARIEVVVGLRIVAATAGDANGSYRLANVPPGTYDVVARRLGHQPSRSQGVVVAAGGTVTLDFALTPSPTRLDVVVATPNRGAAQKALDAPAQVNVVSEEAIEERATVTLAGHVQGMAGVDVNQGGVAQSNIVARGFNNAFSGSMLMMQDYRFAGVPSLRVNIPLLFTGTNEDIERVEVLLGPASALFGPNSANGVLHVISKSPFTSQGTTITVDGGERSLFRGSLRTAYALTPKMGVKLSGEYMRADDFEYHDPGEPDQIPRGGTNVPNVRDFNVERFSGEARIDLRPRDGLEMITSVGATQIGSGLELTGANGTAQIRNWRFINLQQRLSWNRFFVQGFINSSDAGNKDSLDTRGTFLLRSGQPIVDQSQVYSVQAQHGFDLGEKYSITYGSDFIYTNPTTGGTINGRNEDIDDIVEYGGYVQGSAKLASKVDLLGALRADQHDQVDGTFLSPRVALIFKPIENQNVRLTYNRAFNTPQNFSFFLDLIAQRNPAGLPFNVRAMGNPPKEGWQFNRSCAGALGNFCMRSAFVPSSLNGAPMIPALAGLGLPGLITGQSAAITTNLSNALQANAGLSPAQAGALATSIVNDLRTPRAELNGITTVMRNLGQTAVLDPTSIVDIEPLKASFNNTYEVGYKGLMGQRIRFDVATYYQTRGDVATPATIATPSVFMDPASSTAYMQPRIQAILEGAGFTTAQATALSTGMATSLSSGFAPVPMGTVTFNNARLAPGADVLATYRRLDKEVELWGTDIAMDFVLSDEVTLTGTYGYASEVVFDDPSLVDQRGAPFTLNAPGHKASLTGRYTSAARGWGGELRGRYTDGFPVNSGVYSSYGTFVDPNAVGGTYTYEPVPVNMLVDAGVNYRFTLAGRRAMWALTVTNLLNNEKPTFPGVPSVGRLAVTRIQYSF